MAPQKDYDVMISYEDKSGEGYMKVLCEKLKSAGLTVCVDKEDIFGNINDSMARAVKLSHIIIILLSKDYATSHNCESEIEHAKKCKTEIIPVMVEDYIPPTDTALSLFLSENVYYKVYGNGDATDDIINAVMKHLQKCDAEDERQLESFDVIFSYELNSGKNLKNKLVAILRDADIAVYDNDEKLEFPEVWTDKMAGSSVVILLLSRDYCQSEICENQFECAVQAKKKIIPIKVEKFDPHIESPIAQFMKNMDSYELYEKFDENAMKVVRTVERHLCYNESSNANRKTINGGVSSPFYKKHCEPNECYSRKGDNTRCGEFSPHKGKNVEQNEMPSNTKSWKPTINIYGGNVIIGDYSSVNISNDSSQQSYAAAQQTIVKPRPGNIQDKRSFGPETHIDSYSNTRSSLTTPNRSVTQLSPDEAFRCGLERVVGDLNEDFREELAMKLDSQSGIVANWIVVARALDMDAEIIKQIEDKGTAHRLLFYKIRDHFPHLTLNKIKDILETKMKRKARRDIFYDYQRKGNLPPLSCEIGSLNMNEFEQVLKNVADKLVADPVRGHWRHLGGHLGFTSFELDEIMSRGKTDNVTTSSRIFIEYLVSRAVKIGKLVSALKSDTVKRMDLNLFITDHLKANDCWN